MAYILDAPLILAACIIDSPTAPKPQTATVDPGSILQLFQMAPHPVLIPQPTMQTFLKSALGFIFAAEI